MLFCFKQKTGYEMRISDWSSDVCSSDLPGTWLTIARIDAAPVGFALVRSVLDECELLLLAVSPLWRGRGIGEALLFDSLRTARRRGITSMNLEVRASYTAIRLYEKAGFDRKSTRLNSSH